MNDVGGFNQRFGAGEAPLNAGERIGVRIVGKLLRRDGRARSQATTGRRSPLRAAGSPPAVRATIRPRRPGPPHKRLVVHHPISKCRTCADRRRYRQTARPPQRSPHRRARNGWRATRLPPSGSTQLSRNRPGPWLRAVPAAPTGASTISVLACAWRLCAISRAKPARQARRSLFGARLEPIENLGLPPRPQLQATVALGILDRRDLGRDRKPPLDQFEDIVVNSVELGTRRREPSQLFICHGSSRSCAA